MVPRPAYGYMATENLLAFSDLHQRYGIGSDSRKNALTAYSPAYTLPILKLCWALTTSDISLLNILGHVVTRLTHASNLYFCMLPEY
jgi:hypothetical protein